MKKIVVMLAISLTFVTNLAAEGKSTELCHAYIDQVKNFEKTMGDDEISKKTLAFYQKKREVFCGNLSSKTKFEKKSFLAMMAKDNKTTTAECKQAINMASEYSKTKKQTALITAAHKENIVDNCGDLVAAHVSAFCLYDEAK